MKCHNPICLYEWNYKGNAKIKTSCPRCGWHVFFSRQKMSIKQGLKNFSGLK